MFDAHVHLDFLTDGARERYVRGARQQGVTAFAVPGVSPSQWGLASSAAQEAGGIWGVGIHPEHVTGTTGAELTESRVREASFVGETGLDARLEETFSAAAQESLFVAHVDLAESLSRPLVVHSVRRHGRILELVRHRNVRGLVHGFVGSAEIAQRYCALGWSLGAGLRARKSTKTAEAFRQVPLSSPMTESDEPGEHSDVPEVVAWLAALRGVSTEEIATVTGANARAFFGV